jgi:hypothetical protein
MGHGAWGMGRGVIKSALKNDINGSPGVKTGYLPEKRHNILNCQ